MMVASKKSLADSGLSRTPNRENTFIRYGDVPYVRLVLLVTSVTTRFRLLRSG